MPRKSSFTGNSGFPQQIRFLKYHGPAISATAPTATLHCRQRQQARHGASTASNNIGSVIRAVYFVASINPTAIPTRAEPNREDIRSAERALTAERKKAATNKSSFARMHSLINGLDKTAASAASAAAGIVAPPLRPIL